MATSARRVPHVTFLQSTNGLRLLGAADGVLSVHTLAPYPGWESFVEQAREAVEALPAEARSGRLTMVAVRYIDRITLPSTDVVFGDFLTVMPARLPGLPPQLAGFHLATQTIDPADGTDARLTVASTEPGADGRPVIIYDLTVQRGGSSLGTLAHESWMGVVEDLHQRQREVFEASITDRARELFQ